MNIENILKTIRIAYNIADWFSVEQHVDYDFDFPWASCLLKGELSSTTGTSSNSPSQ